MVLKEVNEMSKADFNFLLKFFVLEVRKKDGERYGASSLKDFVSMLQYHLQAVLKRNWSIWKDAEFIETRQALDIAMKESTKEGKGAGLRKANAIPNDAEERLWSEGILGLSTPTKLQNALLWLVGLHFALRGGSELRDIEFEKQVRLGFIDGEECLEYKENRITKNNQGGLKTLRKDPKVVRTFHSPDHQRCIVCVYKEYVSHRPIGCCTALFLAVNRNWKAESEGQWYTKGPIGRHTLSTVVSDLMKKVAPTDMARYTNQSLRKTCATRLHEGGVQRADICRVTGHSSTAVEKYISVSVNQQKQISNIVSATSGSPPAVPPVPHHAAPATPTTTIPTYAESSTPKKKMRVDICGETNRISINFD